MSNRRRPKMSAAELQQLEADWARARSLERMARDLASEGESNGPGDDEQAAHDGRAPLQPGDG